LPDLLHLVRHAAELPRCCCCTWSALPSRCQVCDAAGADSVASGTNARGCTAWPVVVEVLHLAELATLQPIASCCPSCCAWCGTLPSRGRCCWA
jgi:hypothetical protein